ncbi:MAG: hypothetical protein HZB19_08055 [Chloroflexi bacterium]|nr:hypothetical protein [Chloroflexota bacterium]
MQKSINFRNRLPEFPQIVPVFAVISFVVFGWTTFRFAQKLPSWLNYLRMDEIVSIYAYTVLTNFVESIIAILLLLGLVFILPRRFFLDRFVASGALISFLGIGYLIYLALISGESKSSQFPLEVFYWFPIIAVIILLIGLALPLVHPVRKFFEMLSDRFTVFLYLQIPLGILGAIIVLANNLF